MSIAVLEKALGGALQGPNLLISSYATLCKFFKHSSLCFLICKMRTLNQMFKI